MLIFAILICIQITMVTLTEIFRLRAVVLRLQAEQVLTAHDADAFDRLFAVVEDEALTARVRVDVSGDFARGVVVPPQPIVAAEPPSIENLERQRVELAAAEARDNARIAAQLAEHQLETERRIAGEIAEREGVGAACDWIREKPQREAERPRATTRQEARARANRSGKNRDFGLGD